MFAAAYRADGCRQSASRAWRRLEAHHEGVRLGQGCPRTTRAWRSFEAVRVLGGGQAAKPATGGQGAATGREAGAGAAQSEESRSRQPP